MFVLLALLPSVSPAVFFWVARLEHMAPLDKIRVQVSCVRACVFPLLYFLFLDCTRHHEKHAHICLVLFSALLFLS